MYMKSSQHAGTFDHKHHSVITSGCDIVKLCIRYVLQFLVCYITLSSLRYVVSAQIGVQFDHKHHSVITSGYDFWVIHTVYICELR